MSDLDQILCKATSPKAGVIQKPQRLQQVLNELDGRGGDGAVDFTSTRTRYPRLPQTIRFFQRLADALSIILFLGLAGIALLFWIEKLNVYAAVTLGVTIAVGLMFQRALCVLMSEGATLAVDCERSLRVQREATLHLIRMMEEQTNQLRSAARDSQSKFAAGETDVFQRYAPCPDSERPSDALANSARNS